jgi:selenocysteine lyase/cysteine desulfurase
MHKSGTRRNRAAPGCVHVPIAADGYIPLENFERVIDENTQLVAITHVCFRNGAKLDIPGIVKLAHTRGAKVLLDSYQAAGNRRLST